MIKVKDKPTSGMRPCPREPWVFNSLSRKKPKLFIVSYSFIKQRTLTKEYSFIPRKSHGRPLSFCSEEKGAKYVSFILTSIVLILSNNKFTGKARLVTRALMKKLHVRKYKPCSKNWLLINKNNHGNHYNIHPQNKLNTDVFIEKSFLRICGKMYLWYQWRKHS